MWAIAAISIIPPEILIGSRCFHLHSSWSRFPVFIMPFFFGGSHSTRCYGSKYSWLDIIFRIFPKEKERYSDVYFNWFAVWKWIRDSWLFDSRTQVVHQKWTTHPGHLATAGELCPWIPDLIGFVKFFNVLLFLRLRVGSARTDRKLRQLALISEKLFDN